MRPPQGGPPAADKAARVFWSSHLTPGHDAARQKWLSPALESDATTEIKFSLPPFNNANGLEYPAAVQKINAPAYGPNITSAVLNMFTSPEMRGLAENLKVHIPPCTLSTFIQSKMPKVHDMIRHCRETPEIAGSSAAAIQRLSRFVEEFEALDGSSIGSATDWDAFVARHADPGWKARIHFDHLLGNFGFGEEAASAIRRATLLNWAGQTVTFEAHACRWLGHALQAYGPEGCLVDVVNLVFAMTGDDPAGLSDVEIAGRIDSFYRRVVAKDTAALWIPTHLLMDAELDDCLSWVLLERVLEGAEPRLSVLIQLPADEEFDGVAGRWEGRPGCEVWRDPDSRNAEALRNLFLKNKTREVESSEKEEPRPKGKGRRKGRRRDAPGPKGKGKAKGEKGQEPKGKGKGKSKSKAEPESKGKGETKGEKGQEPKGKGKGKGKRKAEPESKGKGKDTVKGKIKSKAEPEPKGKSNGEGTGKEGPQPKGKGTSKGKGKGAPEPTGKGRGKGTGKGKIKSKAEPEPKGKGRDKDSKSGSWDYPPPSSRGKKGSSKGKSRS